MLGVLTYRLSFLRKLSFVALMILWCLGSCFSSAYVAAQPPGTLPPSTITQPIVAGAKPVVAAEVSGVSGKTAEASPLEPKAFLMLDSAGNPVIMPGMTFEKLDRLMQLEEGLARPAQTYAIESMTLTGRVDDGHAELNITTRIIVEPTGDSWVSIPLRMGNFHRTGTADISGVENYRMDLSADGSGYLLQLQTTTRRTVVVAMRVVVRVSAPPTAAIEFRLPETVCDITLNLPDTGVSASIVGRGDEVLRTSNVGQSTEVKIESGGGTFSLRFGTQVPVIDNRPVLETESQIVVDWQQADDSPLAQVDMRVRNLRGDLPKVSLLVPGSLRLLQQPEVLNGGPFEVLDVEGGATGSRLKVRSEEEPLRIDLAPLASRGDSQVEVSLDGQMRSEGGLRGGMVIVAPIAMDDATQQRGEIEVRTPRDYRLRWNSHPWVHSVWEKADSDLLSTRVYRFRFDRVPFELPIWLSARARQLRIESDLRVTLYDSLASLRMSIKTNGSIPDSRILPIEVGPWKVQSVFVADTTTPVESDRNGDTLEIDLASLPGGGNEGDRIEVVLVKPLVSGETNIDLPLPRIAARDESVGTLQSTLTVVSQNDSRFVIDLTSSVGMGEVLRRNTAAATALEDSLGENRYSLLDLAQESRLAGFLVRERPSASLLVDAEVSVVADRITEVVEWTIYPQGGLRGRLPIAWGELSGPVDQSNDASTINDRVPSTVKSNAIETVAPTPPGAGPAIESPPLALTPLTPWSVVVDDQPATVRLDADGRYQVYSDRLSGGPHRIRFRRTRSLPATPTGMTALTGVYLPHPTLSDVTLRGPIVVRLRGSNQWELTTPGTDGRLLDELSFTSFPQKHLPLQLKPIERPEDDLVIRRGVLRTVVGDSTHYDQLLAMVEGGGILRIGLSKNFGDVLPRAAVDGLPADVIFDANNRCVIRLGERGIHRVELQVWVPHESSTITDHVRPVLMLPIGIERLFWQLVVPEDRHLVWATASMGRAMRWELDSWRLSRVSLETDAQLVAWTGVSTDSRMPQGNRYLLVGIDAGSLAATTMSKQAIWLIVSFVVLLTASLLIYVPIFRHPMSAVVGAVAVGGLLLLLPDAAVIAGQLMLVAMSIVAVMSGVRHLLMNRRSDRVFAPSRESLEQPTTRHLGPSREDRIDSYLPSEDPAIASISVAETRA